MIPVFAEGPGAEAFRGIYENTAIFDKIKAALELK
jgi:alkaline phosphatase